MTATLSGSDWQTAGAGALKPVYWQALAVVVVLYFARFDWSFVVLRAKMVSPIPYTLHPSSHEARDAPPGSATLLSAFLPTPSQDARLVGVPWESHLRSGARMSCTSYGIFRVL